MLTLRLLYITGRTWSTHRQFDRSRGRRSGVFHAVTLSVAILAQALRVARTGLAGIATVQSVSQEEEDQLVDGLLACLHGRLACVLSDRAQRRFEGLSQAARWHRRALRPQTVKKL